MPLKDEAPIHKAWSSGNYDQAFTCLIQAYASDFYRTALRIVLDHEAAQDVLQEASIKLWKALPQFKGQSRFSTWATRVVINESLSHLRRQKTHLGLDAIAVAAPSSPYFESDALLEALHDAVNRLPEKQRLTFQLRYFDEKPFAEIADLLGTSVGGLKANYHHATEKVKKHILALNPSYADTSND
jgi:RNA polymerase sigma-70 factor (ECF subfamily)